MGPTSPSPWGLMGGLLLTLGVLLVLLGAVMMWAPSVPWLGRLPGDIRIERDGFGFYLPLTTCLLLSLALSGLLWLLRYVMRL
jgi:hypothetical protein